MAKFDLYIDTLFKHEGVWSNNKFDPGGATKFGITIATWRQFGWDKDNDGDIDTEDLKVITLADAKRIYKPKYWDAIRADEIKSQEVANIIFDHGVNAGISRAVKMAQAVLRTYFNLKTEIDGGLGKFTLSDLNSVDANKFYNEYKKLRVDYYNYLANNLSDVRSDVIPFLKTLRIAPNNKFKEFIKGWLNRANSFADLLIKKKSITITTGVLLTAGTLYLINRYRNANT
jgi:hypothetical protein